MRRVVSAVGHSLRPETLTLVRAPDVAERRRRGGPGCISMGSDDEAHAGVGHAHGGYR